MIFRIEFLFLLALVFLLQKRLNAANTANDMSFVLKRLTKLESDFGSLKRK